MASAESTSGSLDAEAAPEDSQPTESKKRNRKTLSEMAAIRAADLEVLKRKDTTGWTEKRKASHEAAINALTSKVEADSQQLEKIQKRATSKSTASVRAPPMKDDQTRRLIYARKVMDEEFEKCINAAGSKWDMVAKVFNEGFTVKKSIMAGVEEDIIFPPLPNGENDMSGTRLQNKWDKVSKEYRDLMLMKQNIDREICKRTHVGEKRPQDEILTEVMSEIENLEKAFKFADDMMKCQWDQVPHLNPPPRLNSQSPVVTLSASSSSSVATAVRFTPEIRIAVRIRIADGGTLHA